MALFLKSYEATVGWEILTYSNNNNLLMCCFRITSLKSGPRKKIWLICSIG